MRGSLRLRKHLTRRGANAADLIMSVYQPPQLAASRVVGGVLILVSLEFCHNNANCVHARVVLSRLTGEAKTRRRTLD